MEIAPEMLRVELPVTGMTCATCATRIEKKLNKLDGVNASVNYATEKASVEFDKSNVDMDTLVSTIEQAGYGVELPQPEQTQAAPVDGRSAEVHEMRKRLAITSALSLPVLLLSMIPALQFDNWQWATLTLASPVVVWGGWPFHRAAVINARHRAVTMDTLVSVGTIAAYAWSLWALFLGDAGHMGMTMEWSLSLDRSSGSHHIYLEVASIVLVFLLAGRYFETRSKRSAGDAITALVNLGTKDVRVIQGAVERTVPIANVKRGTKFVVRPGEKIATDGVVVDGTSAVDNSLVTGESVPVDVEPGDRVIGATINRSGRIVVEATHVGSDTALAQIAKLVTEAQSGKAPVQRLADKVSSIFVPVVIGLAAITLGLWLWSGESSAFSFGAAVAVLIVACPCALGLATPTALLVGSGRGAQMGIVIKGPEILESARNIDTIVFDKTGTLTTGSMQVVDVAGTQGWNRERLLDIAAAVEHGSEHPIGHAIVAAAPDPVAATNFRNHEGGGVQAEVNGKLVLIGSSALLERHGVTSPPEVSRSLAEFRESGLTAVVVAVDGSATGVIAVADKVKPSAVSAIEHFHRMGLKTHLLTGDHESTARAVAESVGIKEFTSDVLPDAKVAYLKRLQEQGRRVAMVGDGVNDAAALVQADLGIAMGAGTDVAIQASDLTLMSSDLHGAVDAVRLSRRTLSTIKTNLFWAFAYNVIALPLAALGYLNPLVAGTAMALSSVFVVSNSLRLRRFKAVIPVT